MERRLGSRRFPAAQELDQTRASLPSSDRGFLPEGESWVRAENGGKKWTIML
jgi:hypothetical protein